MTAQDAVQVHCGEPARPRRRSSCRAGYKASHLRKFQASGDCLPWYPAVSACSHTRFPRACEQVNSGMELDRSGGSTPSAPAGQIEGVEGIAGVAREMMAAVSTPDGRVP